MYHPLHSMNGWQEKTTKRRKVKTGDGAGKTDETDITALAGVMQGEQ